MTVSTIDEDRPIPLAMRHWFEKAGIYPAKGGGGLHRRWRRYNYLDGRSRKKHFTAGTRDGFRHFRVLPHLDRMDICDGDFDRWANSLAASVQMPKTEAEFNEALDTLLKMSRHRAQEANA